MSIPVCHDSPRHPSHCKIHVIAGLEPAQKVQRVMGILHPKHWRTPTVNSTDTRNMSIQGIFLTACFIRRKPPLRRRPVWSLFPSDIAFPRLDPQEILISLRGWLQVKRVCISSKPVSPSSMARNAGARQKNTTRNEAWGRISHRIQ